MDMQKFKIASEDAELLVLFEELTDVLRISERIRRDPSGISRSLKRLAENYPVLEKKAGKWALTSMGREINELTRAVVAKQSSILASQTILRIGTNREFAARILAPDLSSVQRLFPKMTLSVNAFEAGTEAALLNGTLEIGIDCDRPNDPEIAYKLITPEPIIIVANKTFAHRYDRAIAEQRLSSLPHLLCERLFPDKILGLSENDIEIAGRFNDIATTRSACCAGNGWALLPRYSVTDELNSGKLVQLDPATFGKSKYGIWWPRRRNDLKVAAEKFSIWLQAKEL